MKPWGLVPNPRFEDLANDLLLEKIYKKKKIKPIVLSLSLSLSGTLHITLLDFKPNLDKPKVEKEKS
jgi:hypothetical protein